MTVKVVLATMRGVKTVEILCLIYIFQTVQSDNVKYMPLGYDSIQDRNCVENDRHSKTKVKWKMNMLQNQFDNF